MIKVKCVYDTFDGEDGVRFFVDRLWLESLAPNVELRNWSGHDPAKWNEFRLKYFSELKANPAGWRPVVEAEREGTVKLLYSANDGAHDNAVAHPEFWRSHLTSVK